MDYVPEGMNPRQIAVTLSSRFDLDEEVQANIRVRFRIRDTDRWKYTNSLQLSTILTKIGLRFEQRDFSRLQVVVLRKKGTRYECDCSWDSEFMAKVMPEIGRMMREKLCWLPDDNIINLVLDNAGGHGTKETIADYQELLLI
jgi:hypothetical protein